MYKVGWTKEKIKKVETFDEQVLPADEYLDFNEIGRAHV